MRIATKQHKVRAYSLDSSFEFRTLLCRMAYYTYGACNDVCTPTWAPVSRRAGKLIRYG